MGRNGFIQQHRKELDNPIVCKSIEHYFIWQYLKCEARFRPEPALFNGKKITLNPGQLTTGRKQIANFFEQPISESKVQRVLKEFENEHMIEQQTCTRNRLITIVEWNKYQSSEQLSEQRMNNERTTNEQRANTPEELKNKRTKEIKKKDIPPDRQEVIDYIAEKGYSIDVDNWFDFYQAKGWMIGKNKMKDWKAAVRTWGRKSENNRTGIKPKPEKQGADGTDYDYEKFFG